MNKKLYTLFIYIIGTSSLNAATKSISSPDGKLLVNIEDTNGSVSYNVLYNNQEMLKTSHLGLNTDMCDYTKNVQISNIREKKINTTYSMRGTKASSKHYVANAVEIEVTPKSFNRKMVIEMNVSNNDIAYRYHLEGTKDTYNHVPRRTTILNEASSFAFPSETTTFLCPQIDGNNQGWMATKPSYEEEYVPDAQMNTKSRYGKGYTFPCLFKVGDKGWVLVSETGVGSNYCGGHLSDYDSNTGYILAFPDMTEQHGLGASTPAISLPGKTPWRTITVGSTLKPIAETTISYDVVEQMYEPSQQYKPGRYTWSWLVWQDNSINYDDQVKFIDTAAAMGFEYCLVDNWWDTQIGRKRIVELSKYAQSKGVSLMLWYNSNGAVNDAPQGPRNCMNTSIAREKEMSWLESIGVKGIKVDFFGGDKQQTMQLYEDILSDANRHGIQVVFHGCTLPRGWEKMYPNFVASEAVLASENVYFNEHHAKREGFELTMHPFCRNAVASMDWGGSMMNHWMNKDNKANDRHRRYTSDVFEMAAAITNQTSVQCIDVHPNNLTDMPSHVLDFLKNVPTTWDETQFIDGFPGKYAILARKNSGKWYVAGLNGEAAAKTLTLDLPMFAGKEVTYYTDDTPKNAKDGFLVPLKKTLKVNKNGKAKVTIQGMGGIVVCE